MFIVEWYEDNIRQESGQFNTYEAAERWMRNNLDASIKYAGIRHVEVKSWNFVNTR